MTKENENIIPDTYPLGENGPSDSEVQKLKEKYGKIKACFSGGKIYLVRMMKREEYLEFQEETNKRYRNDDLSYDVDFDITKTCVVWPEKVNWMEEPGGAPSQIAIEVSRFSGFVADRESIEL